MKARQVILPLTAAVMLGTALTGCSGEERRKPNRRTIGIT